MRGPRAIVVGAILVVGSCSAARSAEVEGFTGVLAMRGDQVLAEENADRLFVPASVNKLIVSVAALHHLGPEYRSTTRLRATGPVESVASGVREVRGDLVVEAVGDPSWSDALRAGDARRPLRELAAQLHRSGIIRVTGDLIVDTSRFPGRAIPLDWGRGDSALAYGAAPSALALDENVVRLSMAPGRELGAPALLTPRPGLEVLNQTVTVSSARHGKGTIDFLPVWGTAMVVVRGEYPISEPPFVVRLAAPDPVERAARALTEELATAGIEIAGVVRVSAVAPAVGDAVLAAVESAPLAEILTLVLTDSHNWYAETLVRQLALEVAGEGRLDTGLEVERHFLEQVVGLDPSWFELDDGSGLSPSNLVSPRAIVELLRFGLAQPWRQVLLDSLSSGSKGTLAAWGQTPPLAAKSGTLRHTQTLAGVLAGSGEPPGEPIVFAVFLNHRADHRPALKREIVRRLWEWYRLPQARTQVGTSGGR
jgi:D-alanyl-D-alanine carboxypeptidase/D-alanyl-D-alanine-endopeptidase (penicillin-binding protein 4)